MSVRNNILDFPSFSVLRYGISKAVIISVKIRPVPALGDNNYELVTRTTLESLYFARHAA